MTALGSVAVKLRGRLHSACLKPYLRREPRQTFCFPARLTSMTLYQGTLLPKPRDLTPLLAWHTLPTRSVAGHVGLLAALCGDGGAYDFCLLCFCDWAGTKQGEQCSLNQREETSRRTREKLT